MTKDLRLPRRILVVDDDRTFCDIVRVWLDGDHELVFAHDGEEALRAAKDERRPDLVLLDVMMPRLSGFSVAWVVKNDPKLKGIPVVFMTAHAVTMADAKRKLERADAYLLKPFSRDELLSVVSAMLAAPSAAEVLAAPMATASVAADERRLAPRLAVNLEGMLSPGVADLPVLVSSLSPVGAFLEGDVELSPGARAELRIATRSGNVDAPCRVAYRTERNGRAGYGVELGELSGRSEAIFEQLLHDLTARAAADAASAAT